MTTRHDHKPVAVVTGANRGLGVEAVRRLAELDYRVVATARNVHKGEAAVERLQEQGLDVLFQQLDVSQPQAVAALGEFVRSRCGRLDVLINNAGVFLDSHGPEDLQPASVFSVSLEAVRVSMEVHLYGPLLLAQELVPLMRQQNYGRIVNVSTGMAQLTTMGGRFAAYRSSKTALNALTRILAAETAGQGILVNAVSPGWVRTDMGGPNADRSVEQGVESILWAATLPDDGPTGGFFRDGEPLDW